MQRVSKLVPYVCFVGALLTPSFAAAEGFLDFAIGGAFTQNDDVTLDTDGGSFKTEGEFDESFSTGVRGGYWFEALPWLGVGGMVSYFEPDVAPEDFSGDDDLPLQVIPLTALLMLRAPLLPSDAVPHGHLQPFLNIGPGAFITAVDSHHGDDTSVDVGLDLHAGATWMFTSRFGMFAEYRFTHYTANLDDDDLYYSSNSSFSDAFEIETTLNTHHFMTGFAWHID